MRSTTFLKPKEGTSFRQAYIIRNKINATVLG